MFSAQAFSWRSFYIFLARPSGDTVFFQYGYLASKYAALAFWYLYAALLASPLTQLFPNLPYRMIYVKARRAIGASAFLFGLLHGVINFFLIGGLAGFLKITSDSQYLIAFSPSFVALIILTLMALTSFDSMVVKLGVWLKRLHRLVYIAAVLIVIHASILIPDKKYLSCLRNMIEQDIATNPTSTASGR